MEFLMDPAIWAGLFTLVLLEIILGIDNLVFIAILADKLPPKQRDKARVIGLVLALVMRLALLTTISWMVKLKKPLFALGSLSFTGRDLILLAGGLFLLFKATMELHERLEGHEHNTAAGKGHASFWLVVLQIVILDAVFSLDAVITAVGMMEDNLPVMMAAVIIAMSVMLAASKPLTHFVNQHPTIVVLCLSFLLMIGLSLMAEGLGFAIPKGYLYAAIGFSILIELFNQIARHNFDKNQSRRPMRERTAEAIMRMIGGRGQVSVPESPAAALPAEAFAEEERYMISGVLTLASRSIRSVMTPRSEITWVDCEHSAADIRTQLLDTPHSLFPVCRGSLDEVVGVVRAKELLVALEQRLPLADYAAQMPAIVVPDRMDVINLMGVLRRAKGRLVMVSNEFGMIQGLVTPLDVLEAIAGEFPDEDETPEIVVEGTGWMVKGGTDLHSLEQVLDCQELVSPNDDYATLAGMLLAHFGQMPAEGEVIELHGLRCRIVTVSEYRIDMVYIEKSALYSKEEEAS